MNRIEDIKKRYKEMPIFNYDIEYLLRIAEAAENFLNSYKISDLSEREYYNLFFKLKQALEGGGE